MKLSRRLFPCLWERTWLNRGAYEEGSQVRNHFRKAGEHLLHLSEHKFNWIPGYMVKRRMEGWQALLNHEYFSLKHILVCFQGFFS